MQAYCGSEHRSIRHYQQGRPFIDPEFVRPREETLETFIEKSPKWKAGKTYRAVGLTDSELSDIISRVKVGSVIDMEGTSSWTSSLTVANTFEIHDKNRVVYVCDTQRKGVAVMAYSETPYEYPTINGKRTHIRAKSQKDLEQKIQERKSALIVQLQNTSKGTSLVGYAKEWLNKKQSAPEQKRIRLTTLTEYQRYICYIERYFADSSLEALSTQRVQDFADWMAFGSQNGLKQDIVENTIARTLATLNQIVKDAVEVSECLPKLPYKPSLIINKGKPSKHFKAVPSSTFQEIMARIPALKDSNERILMSLLLTTGLRPEEIYGLKWEDIAPDWSYLHIQRAVTYPTKNHPHINIPKTERSNRYVNLMNWVAQILKAEQKNAGYVLGGETPLCYVTRSRLQRSAWKNVGLEGKKICMYDFRANFATVLCESGKSDKQVADLMGHADTRMVDRIYAPARKEGILKQKDDCEKLFGQ